MLESGALATYFVSRRPSCLPRLFIHTSQRPMDPKALKKLTGGPHDDRYHRDGNPSIQPSPKHQFGIQTRLVSPSKTERVIGHWIWRFQFGSYDSLNRTKKPGAIEDLVQAYRPTRGRVKPWHILDTSKKRKGPVVPAFTRKLPLSSGPSRA